jgi:putative GTP pyrophosphokinase
MDSVINLKEFKLLKTELTRFMMAYKFALDEMDTKINILSEEFNYMHEYNPIEHVKSRVKSPESIINKIYRKGCEPNLDSIRENIRDIAGLRITCSFISDIYEISKMIQKQKDIKVVEYKDYIKNPKPNGYQSLHMIIEIPIFMSDREVAVYVEIQIRTIAMDFWASLEHKIFYKYNKEVPQKLLNELREASRMSSELDKKMERINVEVNHLKKLDEAEEEYIVIDNNNRLNTPLKFLEALIDK